MKIRQRGLTLIELLTVVAIIAILAATLLPYAFNRLEDSRISRTEQDISSLKSAVALFFNDNSTLPNIWDDFVTPPAGFTNWRGPYINKAPNPGNTNTWIQASAWKTNLHNMASRKRNRRSQICFNNQFISIQKCISSRNYNRSNDTSELFTKNGCRHR